MWNLSTHKTGGLKKYLSINRFSTREKFNLYQPKNYLFPQLGEENLEKLFSKRAGNVYRKYLPLTN